MSNSDVLSVKLLITVEELWSRMGVQGMAQGQMTAQYNSTCTLSKHAAYWCYNYSYRKKIL